MLRSMFSGVSGLRSHQTMMDVVGNNIANVNTAGFKSSSVVFADTLSQLTKAAGAPTDAAAGTNPAQVGLGVRVDAITQNMTQGSAQATGKATDLMLQGDGMFAIQQGDGTFYSRNGSFTLDANGSVVTNDGGYVMGWKADATGDVNTNGQIGKLVIPSDTVMPAVETTKAQFKGNIDRTYKAPTTTPDLTGKTADANGDYTIDGTTVTSSFTSYDAQGVATTVFMTFTNQVKYTPPVAAGAGTPGNAGPDTIAGNADDVAAIPGTPAVAAKYQPSNDWKIAGKDSNGKAVNLGGKTTVNFDPDGKANAANNMTATIAPFGTNAGYSMALDLSGLTSFVGTTGTSSVNPVADGAPIGTLTGFAFGTDGVITGNYSNGYKQTLGQIAIASFNNAAGLRKEGNSLYSISTNSGQPVFGIAGGGGRGAILAGSLEMSNVDLSSEFTNLILAQRGFQANSKVITASDEILQDLVNLKR
ncbi:flagellar hook protein FlgE [Kineococcus sp. GCM10028916]|uniref:flagellar hook protein FlgE n=1 Tax=Kineococcus sp. GCM10028916 TaxID=3273394 RepID=UPI00363A7073